MYVFVLEGGFSESGYDVRVLDQPAGKEFFPHLEKGDMLLLKGGSSGVAHDVDFHGDPERKDWRERLTVVGGVLRRGRGGNPRRTRQRCRCRLAFRGRG